MAKQEYRSVVLTLKVTPTEKTRLAFVAGARGVDVSDIVRELGIEQAMDEAARLQESLASSDATVG